MSFSGGARRSEYWSGRCSSALLRWRHRYPARRFAAFLLGVLLPGIAMGARRLHDIGKSGWWQLLGLIPLLGWLVLLYWAVHPSEDDNDFGPKP
ncbi:MAG: DUF805 domain-containing protein [Burkholderiaceae bacterium]